MNVEFVPRNCQIDDRTREEALRRLEKVVKFLEEPIEATVAVESGHYDHTVEVHLTHRHGNLQAKEQAGMLPEAVQAAIEKAERQARRGRKRAKDRKRRAGRENGGWPVDVVERDSVGGGNSPRVIKTSLLQIKPMTIEEAALRLEDSRNEFFVFRDAETDQVAVLYKRKDANYGLIAPEF